MIETDIRHTRASGFTGTPVWGKGWTGMRPWAEMGEKPYLINSIFRFFAAVHFSESGCWEWKGAKHNFGYGVFSYKSKYAGAHRWSYNIIGGKLLTVGLTIDHLCRNPSCVNPDHMEEVSIRENTMRGISNSAINSRKTHCIRGHEFSGSNLYLYRDGHRACQICRKALNREWKKEKRACIGK